MNKIQVLLRHSNGSDKRKQEVRPDWFSFKQCYNSLFSRDNVDITVFLDGTKEKHHHEYYSSCTVFETQAGSDARSLLNILEYFESKLWWEKDTIVYICEDDYLHRPGWDKIMIEGFKHMNVDYMTLYDHPDKYFLPMYNGLQSTLLTTPSCHWRTTPSTTNTYACTVKTLQRHLEIHKKYCQPGITHDGYDHTKFMDLWNQGSNLVSPMPGYSTHCEKQFLSPIIDWKNV